MIRIPYNDLKTEFQRILLKTGFPESNAQICAEVFTQNTLDGVNSHGINRFPRFIRQVNNGDVIIDAEPEKTAGLGALEQWDGNQGPGILNALASTDRAMELARQYGIGCVALAKTNHWMRGGTYGWRAAEQGFIFIGWTNTLPNLPAWGAKDSRLGNNPIIFAMPEKNGAVVLDMAVSQFSYGKIESYMLAKKELPIPGGYNKDGELTTNAAEILESNRALPMGYWKGAGFSLLLDIIATVLSGGLSTHEVGKLPEEFNMSQVYICFDTSKLGNAHLVTQTVANILRDYKQSVPDSPDTEIRYPGERVLQMRKENLTRGIPVDPNVWQKIKAM